jgi:hypothetical protein
VLERIPEGKAVLERLQAAVFAQSLGFVTGNEMRLDL